MTVREKEILQFIIDFKRTNGYSPTTKEIMIGVNTRSRNFVEMAVGRLADEGYITIKPRSPRTIVVKKFIS